MFVRKFSFIFVVFIDIISNNCFWIPTFCNLYLIDLVFLNEYKIRLSKFYNLISFLNDKYQSSDLSFYSYYSLVSLKKIKIVSFLLIWYFVHCSYEAYFIVPLSFPTIREKNVHFVVIFAFALLLRKLIITYFENAFV